MHISVSVTESNIHVDQDFCSFDVSPDMTVADVKALIEGEMMISSAIQHLFHPQELKKNPADRRGLENGQTLGPLNLSDDDVLILVVRDPTQITDRRRQQNQAGPSRNETQQARRGPDIEQIRLQALGNSDILDKMRQLDPDLASTVHDQNAFHGAMEAFQRRQAQVEAEKEAKLALLNADSFNADAQREIEKLIRQERVNNNIQKALEEHPEVFGHVTMLYIPVVINGQKVNAFVDSGAQTTIMSPSCADRCNVSYLIDIRYQGIARGVGTAKILGRVHSAEIEIGSYSLSCSFTVMEGKDVELLLGLDMLKRHQMSIDLMKNCLRIQSEEVPFLGEADIPKYEEEKFAKEPTVEGPGGAKIGAESGAIHDLDENSASSSTWTPANEQAPPSSSIATSSKQPLRNASSDNLTPAQRREIMQNALRKRFPGSGSITAQASPSHPQPISSEPTPQPQSQQAQQIPQILQPTAAGISRTSIEKITELGYSTDEATWALQQANGDVDLAISLLLE